MVPYPIQGVVSLDNSYRELLGYKELSIISSGFVTMSRGLSVQETLELFFRDITACVF